MGPAQHKFMAAHFVLILVVITVLQATLFGPHTETRTCSSAGKHHGWRANADVMERKGGRK
jgi:hypothetical protein